MCPLISEWTDKSCNQLKMLANFLLVASVLATVSAVESIVDGWQCSEGTLLHNGVCYDTGTTMATWTDARDYCRSRNGDLATIKSDEVNQFIIDNFAATPSVWLGLHDRKGSFAWSDGDSSAYRNWNAGEPDNGNGGKKEQCVTMSPAVDAGKWNDAQCMSTANALCEYSPISSCTLGNTISCSISAAIGLSDQIREEYIARSGVSFSKWNPQWVQCAHDGYESLSIDTALGLIGINKATYKASDALNDQVIVTTLASILGLPASFIKVTKLSNVPASGRRHLQGTSVDQVTVMHTLTIPDVEAQGYASADIAIALLSTSFRDALADGSFIAKLQSNAALLDATSMMSVTPGPVAYGAPAVVTVPSTMKCSGYIQTDAVNALEQTARDKGKAIEIIGDWRSSAQVYLRHRWITNGICDVNKNSTTGDNLGTLPGADYHSAGRVVSLKNSVADFWKKDLKAHGFHMPKPNDDKNYFEYLQNPQGAEVASNELKAFQSLWNKNMPFNRIKLTGKFDAATEQAFMNAPCGGW